MPRAQSSAVLLAAALACAAPAAAQAPQGAAAGPAAAADATSAVTADPATIYRREVFVYDRRGRPDPFRPLVSIGELGIRLEDLQLRGIVYNADPRRSVAVFTHADTAQSLRMRVGQRFGNVTVAAIQPRRVDVRVDEFGTSRMESLVLTRPTAGVYPAPGSQPAADGVAPAGAQPQPAGAEPAPASPRPLQRVQARNRAQAREQAQQQPTRSQPAQSPQQRQYPPRP